MEKYLFKIEGDRIVNPEGWKDFELRLKRDDDIVGLLVSSTNEFIFKGDGYDILKTRFDDNFNDKVNVTIEILQPDQSYKLQYSGVVILTNVQFNLEKKLASTTVEDASFQGAISGNKSIKTFLDTDLTKNSEKIDAITIFNMDFFQPNGNFTPIVNRRLFLYKDALDLLVRFMTDDLVKGVQSAYLDDVNNFGGDSLLYITTGEGIRVANPLSPNVSFAQLITFLSKTHDLTFDFVTDTNGDPVMRIEEREFFFGTANSDTIRDIIDLTVDIDELKIGSHIEIGNNTTFPTGNCSATTRFFSFQNEDYALSGKGNVDNLIDLKTDFINDSNVIEEIVRNNNDSFEEDIIVVMGNAAGTQATRFQSTQYCSNNFFYNLEFTNDNILSRLLAGIPGSVIKFLVGGSTPCKVFQGADRTDVIAVLNITFPEITAPQVSEHFLNFIDVDFDIGSNYNVVPQTHYDVPFEGAFSFSAFVAVTFAITEPVVLSKGRITRISIRFQIAIQRFDVTLTTLKEESRSPLTDLTFIRPFVTPGVPSDGFTQINPALRTPFITKSVTMDCDTSDRIVVKIFYTVFDGQGFTEAIAHIPAANARFFCLGAAEDNGVFEVFDPLSFRARRYKFQKNLSLTRSDNIRANSRSSILINELSDTSLDKITHIEEMRNNIETGETSFTTIN